MIIGGEKMRLEDFPMLKNNIIYFDNGATTFKPYSVIEAINDYYKNYTANAHRGDYDISLEVDNAYEEVRDKVRDFIHAKRSDEIVFTSGTTDSLNRIVFGYFGHYLKSGDEVLITKSEHASNVLPWFALEKELGIKVNYIPLNDDKEVEIDSVKKVINGNTKVISVSYVTNVIGDVRPIKEIVKLAHENNILVVVDGAQSTPHMGVDVVDLDIDFYAFSAHKMYGPTGVGVLYGKYEILDKMIPLEYGGGMNATFEHDGSYVLKELPARLEAGTPNIAGVIGLGASIDYINSIGIDKINKYEHELREYLISGLEKLDFITIYNKKANGSVVAFNINGVFSQDTSVYLNKYNICIRAGNHCAKILKDELNIKNTCRISLSFYNTKEEIDLLLNCLRNSENIWKEIL